MMRWKDYDIEISTNRTSGNVKVLCPQCRDKRSNKHDRSLSADLSTGMFKCHYCGWSGCAAERQDNWRNQQPFFNPRPLSRNKPEYKKPKHIGSTAISDKVIAWFESRGIDRATVEKLNIAEGLEWMPQKAGQANTIQFNYFRDGELVNTKFRTADKCFKLVSGAELLPYNIDAIKGAAECVITEGEMDALSFIACGRTDAVSVPNGASANLNYLDDYLEGYFDDKATIYIAVDTDTKGVALRDELARRFGVERCRIVEYGDDCKDANEHLIKYGQASLLECLAKAREIKVEGVFSVSDFEQSLDALFENGLQKGATIGHDNFDRLCSFETKRLCVVTGVPGSGKSEFIDAIAELLNLRYGWRFAYFSPENAPLAYHASKLIEKFSGKKFSKESLGFGEYRQAKEHLEDNFFFISPSDSFTVDTILEKAEFLVRRKGIKVLVIDPYNRLESQQGNRPETQYISELLDKLTNFAQMNDVLIILMAHPIKQTKGKDGEYEVPTPYSISGSANFFNKADFAFAVHRNRTNNIVEVHVQKVKFKHLGECGQCSFKYNINNGRYVPFYDSFEGETVWDNENHLVKHKQQQLLQAEQNSVLNFDNVTANQECPY